MTRNKQEAFWGKDEQRWSTLMVQSQNGDDRAYNQLLAELGSVIEAYLRTHFGSLLALEDCVQECLLAIHRARHTYDPKRTFRPWFFTIIHHKTVDVLRRGETANKVLSTISEQNIEHDYIDLDRVIDGLRLMKILSDEQREAIMLTKYQGMTTVEAAQSIGINESALKARLRRGLRLINKQWQADWTNS